MSFVSILFYCDWLLNKTLVDIRTDKFYRIGNNPKHEVF